MDAVFVECFGGLKDPRIERTKKHLLLDIIALALCGVISKELNSIARVIYTSEANGEVFTEKRLYISSLLAESPLDILHATRAHWQIESCLHWSLDVTFREDDCRIRDENAALNMSWLRKFALGLLKNEKSFKRASIRRKQLKVWASPDYLSKILKQNQV